MIQEIHITNIGPFRDEAVLNLVATKFSGKLENVVQRVDFSPVLNVALIYGANASGKTHFVKALYRLIEQLKGADQSSGSPDLRKYYHPYLLDISTADTPSMIKLVFDFNDNLYEYSVSFNKTTFIDETLLKKENGEWHHLMIRKAISASNHVITVKKENELTFDCFPYVLGLTHAKYIKIDEVSDVARYIRSISVCNGYNNEMMGLLWEDEKRFLGDGENRTRRKEQLSRFLNAVGVEQNGIIFPVSDDAPFDKISFQHKQIIGKKSRPILFNQSLESTGSKWLLLLGAKVIQTIEEGGVLVVDEMDSCFHSQVTQAIMRLFTNPNVNKKNAQLVITTHHINLMDEKMLRKDQVWFVQKDDRGVSELFCLDEFEGVEENTPFSKWYEAKRFGATPYIEGLERVFDI